MKATHTSSNSAAAQLQRLMEEAACSRSTTEEVVERVARIYTPLMVFGAGMLAIVPWFVTSHDKASDLFHLALVMLVIACPCALVISTPITYVCSMARAAQLGILVKGGKHLVGTTVMLSLLLSSACGRERWRRSL